MAETSVADRNALIEEVRAKDYADVIGHPTVQCGDALFSFNTTVAHKFRERMTLKSYLVNSKVQHFDETDIKNFGQSLFVDLFRNGGAKQVARIHSDLRAQASPEYTNEIQNLAAAEVAFWTLGGAGDLAAYNRNWLVTCDWKHQLPGASNQLLARGVMDGQLRLDSHHLQEHASHAGLVVWFAPRARRKR
jgi:hypothetical protein